MKFSQKVVFRHGRLEQASHDCCQDSYVVRFMVDGEAFFTNLLLFEDPDELRGKMHGLTAGQEVFLGAHRLDDGSFWLHWLKAPGSIELVPMPLGEAARRAQRTWGLRALLCLLFALGILFGGEIGGGTIVFCVLLISGGLFCLVLASEAVADLVNSATSVDKNMRRGLELLNACLADGRAWDVPGPEPGSVSGASLPKILPDGLRLCTIGRVNVRSSNVNLTIPHPGGYFRTVSVDFLVYAFRCGRETVSWPVRDETCGLLRTPAFRRRHPPFLAVGDRVIAYCAESPDVLAGFMNKPILPSMKGKQALELFNCTDQTAYRSETDHRGSVPTLYAAMGFTLAFTTLLMVPIIALAGNSEPWFLPALLSLLKTVAVVFAALVVAMGALLLLMELFINLSARNPKIAAGRKLWRETIAPLRRKTDVPRSPHRERLFAHRLVIVPFCMALAAGSLLLFFLS